MRSESDIRERLEELLDKYECGTYVHTKQSKTKIKTLKWVLEDSE